MYCQDGNNGVDGVERWRRVHRVSRCKLKMGDDDGSELNCGLGSVGTLFVE